MWKFAVRLYFQVILESTGMKSHHHYWLNMRQARITAIYTSRQMAYRFLRRRKKSYNTIHGYSSSINQVHCFQHIFKKFHILFLLVLIALNVCTNVRYGCPFNWRTGGKTRGVPLYHSAALHFLNNVSQKQEQVWQQNKQTSKNYLPTSILSSAWVTGLKTAINGFLCLYGS